MLKSNPILRMCKIDRNALNNSGNVPLKVCKGFPVGPAISRLKISALFPAEDLPEALDYVVLVLLAHLVEERQNNAVIGRGIGFREHRIRAI